MDTTETLIDNSMMIKTDCLEEVKQLAWLADSHSTYVN